MKPLEEEIWAELRLIGVDAVALRERLAPHRDPARPTAGQRHRPARADDVVRVTVLVRVVLEDLIRLLTLGGAKWRR